MIEIVDYKNIFYPSKNDSAVIRSLLNNRVWEKKIIKIFNKYVKKDDTVLDVGSYIGLHTFTLSELANKVYSFEPVPLISKCVEKSIKAKNIKNVIHLNVACGDTSHKTFIHTNHNGDSSLAGIRDHMFIQKFECQVIKLDDKIYESIKLIKIDVEGSEWSVLNGASRIIEDCKPIIILETFKTKRNLKNLVEFCEYYNYNFEYISGDNYLLLSKDLEI